MRGALRGRWRGRKGAFLAGFGRLRVHSWSSHIPVCLTFLACSGVFAACVRAIFLFNDDDDDIKHKSLQGETILSAYKHTNTNTHRHQYTHEYNGYTKLNLHSCTAQTSKSSDSFAVACHCTLYICSLPPLPPPPTLARESALVTRL